MAETRNYSARNVFEGLKNTFHQYLEAQYHIWDEDLIAERRRLLNSHGTTFQEPRLEATPYYATGKTYREQSIPQPAKDILTLASSRSNVGIYREPYVHQAAALEAFLGRGEEIIVATGTGSGKTECFLMPILGALAIESAERPNSWMRPGCRAILLYPMNALVNDQLSRLRRLFGDTEIAQALKGNRDRRATFGMYTSRTPYPGKDTVEKNRERIGKLLKKQYRDSKGEPLPAKTRAMLEKEGKWPAKDIERFIGSSFKTGSEDSELFSRQEMQEVCPDILITNYSMLEYMLLRPIEKNIFEQTALWLASDPENCLTVVLDEAHMYRGSGGAEVAYLLRRLHSRLRVSRNRLRYILTSASLGSTDEAKKQIKHFAADLTGLESSRCFELITAVGDKKPSERTATLSEAKALSAYDFTSIHKIHEAGVSPAEEAYRNLLAKLGVKTPDNHLDEKGLQCLIYVWLQSFGPAALAANLITSSPQSLSLIAKEIFPLGDTPGLALESLLALMTFAREKEKARVFAPVRSHLFFRGLPGLFACVNPHCSYRVQKDRPSILGRLFSTPQLRCECGARVYELLIHRDCGAAFIRGYLQNEEDKFLWHEPSTGLWSDSALLEAHFLVEVERRSEQSTEGLRTWLHMETGRLHEKEPGPDLACQYRELIRPDGTVDGTFGKVLSFDGECPVCLKQWKNAPKIMNQTTKGEAPFAHLIREQVALQPATQRADVRSPNGGRKALLFSDGRQKAARLARDIPREIEKDVFRQVLILAASELHQIGYEAVLNKRIYVAFVDILAKTGLQLFDGDDRLKLQRDVNEYQEYYGDNLKEALLEFDSTPPPRFTALLMRQIGSPYYSVNALTLAYLSPTKKAMKAIIDGYPSIDKEVALTLAIPWMQGFANQFAFDPDVMPGVRIKASGAEGYPISFGIEAKKGFSKRQRQFLTQRLEDIDSFIAALAKALCAENRGSLYLKPNHVQLEVAIENLWYQCMACTTLSPKTWWDHCPNCLSPKVKQVEPASTNYLRARKDFWRDPVVRALNGTEKLINLSVEEHTAQLSYLDQTDPDVPMPTTEEFERRFRDILIGPSDTSIDVLSSTTTMEVGIDIGSLVAVGLRNIPPQRQNYQQRAGRAGRRGASISTVLTYAQNNPHDNHYFENPELIISGDPPLPTVDTKNPQIIERHIRAQLIQAFFHTKVVAGSDSNLFTMLGETWDFYAGESDFSLQSFRNWIQGGAEVQNCYRSIREWLPTSFDREPEVIAEEFIHSLDMKRPKGAEELDQSDKPLIEFLFSHGYLPSYAFPRNLCALQIEEKRVGHGYHQIKLIQRPQQGLNIALSEYAPGRLVVVDKKTYRIGTVAASSSRTAVDRAERLFTGLREYVHCPECLFTDGFPEDFVEGKLCPLCQSANLAAVAVIQPEVVYPEEGKEINEYDDEQVYTQATSAQLSRLEGETSFAWKSFLSRGKLTAVRTQPLVMVNKGEQDDGFLICSQCGKTSFDGKQSAHERDYLIETPRGVPSPPRSCKGEFKKVYLGYLFTSDILLFNLPIEQPFRFHPKHPIARKPLADALQSFSEALVLAVGRVLDIDIREINAGYRFVRHGSDHFADIFVYDTLSGGAGYATQAEQLFQEIFDEAEKLLVKCDCASSCDKCLRHYGNRLHHGSLDRYLAIDLIRFVKEGSPPRILGRTQQQEELKPLAQMLQLAGWQISYEGEAPMSASHNGRTVSLWSYPSLVDPNALGFIESPVKYSFSPYELSRDLPGAFSQVHR